MSKRIPKDLHKIIEEINEQDDKFIVEVYDGDEAELDAEIDSLLSGTIDRREAQDIKEEMSFDTVTPWDEEDSTEVFYNEQRRKFDQAILDKEMKEHPPFDPHWSKDTHIAKIDKIVSERKCDS